MLEYLIERKQTNPIPIVDVSALKLACSISDSEFFSLANHFNGLAFQLYGISQLQISDSVIGYAHRLQCCTFWDALEYFRDEEWRLRMLPIFAAIATRAQTPCLTLKAILDFGGKVDDGRLVESVALPWFEIMKMIKRNPDSIYEINPYTWEEIIAGAYTRAGFDEVILTPRSGDNGRDVIATKRGIGSVRFFDQVKAYKPGHLVTAEEVRAMVGTVYAANNVSKGVVTTTSQFAPRIVTDDFVKNMIPYRLELKARDDLLTWLDEVSQR